MSTLLIRFIFLIVCFIHLDSKVYQDRPKIEIQNGHLVIETAFDKDIQIRTNGPKSKIFVGGIDLFQLNITGNSGQPPPTTSDALDDYLNGPNGILKRLEALEASRGTQPVDVYTNITILWRRVNRLTLRITSLQNQLNTRFTDDCTSRPCMNGGTCLNLVNGYHCLCPSNWEGPNCDVDVNECRNFAGTDLGCQNGAECINKPGSYECRCKQGWYGLHCTRRSKDCSGGNFEMCGHGTCVSVTTGEGIKCICDQGWTTNETGVACLTDINECESTQGPRCSVNPKVDCINLPGSFRCGQCPQGYEGDGYVCSDIDECITIPNGGCSTSPLVTCHNTIGSRICGACPPGYQGDGLTCSWRGSCNINRGGCHPSAQCIDNPALGGQIAQCICPPGMEGDGVGLNGCYISTGNYSRGCEINPCGIHGQCHQLRSGYTCICFRGYGGSRCDTVNNYCEPNPCLNGGRCRIDESTAKGFRCECTALYTGDLCHVASKTCGGLLQAEEGSIIYPLTNTTYNHNARCAWVIQTDYDKVINVTFSKFNLEAYPECSSDFLQIHDGRSSASQIIGRFCGNEFPKGGNIISTHNNLYFWFRSDQTVAKDGFALHWTSIKPFCGGEIDATTHGHISSPGSPGKYPPNRDCYWHLTTTLGKRIQLHFFSLDIESHSNCSYDYIEIYDGEHSNDPLLNRYCNSTQPPPIQSAGSDLLIHFHSDAYSSGYGFQIAFAPADGVPGCGGYYTSDKGEISSPTYEGTYISNLLCEYKIKTSPGTKVRLNFKKFYLERSIRCRYDYLKVYDGPDENSRLVGRFCGRTFPATYTGSTNQLYLKFQSDHSVGYEGFKINYETVCEETIIGDSGVIKSPGYPFTYPAERVCEYIIGTSPGKAIQLMFQDFNIEDSTHYDCHYDSLQIRDGHNGNASLFGKYCGGSEHTPPLITSTLNYLYLKFTSDRSVSGTGFYANFTTINIACGGIYRETTGLINYPSDSSLYENEQACTWILIAPLGMHIKISWNRFHVEKMPSCRSDYVELSEVDENNESNSLGKYCGDIHPPAITTTTNTLKISFVSDSSVRGEGFSLSYTFLDEKTHCGGTLTKVRGVIHSPGWPKKYANKQDCTWTIRAPPGQQIKLNISQFDLEGPIRNKCDFGDYLEIKNGEFPEAPVIGKYCGNFRNKRIVSMSHEIILRFHSDSYITGRGFVIEWDSTVTGCGGTLTSPSGSISSPNYPSPYNENAECFYKVIVSAGSRIRLTFNELELERTPNCKDDYIEIFDGRDENSPSFGRNCYMKPELRNIETSSNVAFIKFRSDFYIGAKGFLIQYRTYCTNNLTGLYGAIESPGYPNEYPMNYDCLWTINVPLGNKINLTFTDFYVLDFLGIGIWRPSFSVLGIGSLQRPMQCVIDYVQIRDTTDVNVPERLCGKTLPKSRTSRTNSLQIKFVTGASIPRRGFRLEWVRHGCGGHVQKSYGIIEIDSSKTSNDRVECEWIIETPPGTQVNLNVYQVYMMSAVNCSIDAVEIYNGQNLNAPLLTKTCHNNIEGTSISTTSNFMLLRFVKHSSLKDVHFRASFDSYKTGCGGRIDALSGIIHSKNYPQNYDNDLNCMWTLAVPMHHKIELNFIDIDLYGNNEFNEDCGDNIRLYDGEFVLYKNYTQQICSNTRAAKIISKNNILGVQFLTDASGTAKGFKANFTVVCGATIKANYDGVLANDKWHSTHIDNNCTWTILAPSLEKKISLSITYMSIPKDNEIVTNRKCSSSYLRIYDGNDIQAPVIGEYCGRKVPPMIVSKGSALTVVFGAYNGTAQGTFSSHYTPLSSACGGSLFSEEGTIASPNYPLSYPVSIDCEWTLSTSSGNRVYINFEIFDVEYSENCNEDYLEVRENNGVGRLLGVYCGNDIPSNTTTGTALYVKFHSNSKNTGQGFVLHYGFLHGNEITGDRGVISSPLYPNSYEGAGEYSWRVTTDEGKIISMLINRLKIPNNGERCFNKLTFYDGYDEEATILGVFCGIVAEPKEIKTTSNVGFIKLTLDESNWGTTFRIEWTNSDRFIETTDVYDKVNCGNNKTEILSPGQTISLKSPGYSSEYDNDLKCEWVYKATTGNHISLVFKEIKLEQTPMCFADHISVFSSDTSSVWNPVISNICLKEQVTSDINSTNYMKILFKTDSSVTNVGFEAEVESMCGGLMTDLSGVVGPSWMDTKNKYTIQCHWKIKVRPGRVIKLNFEHFNITNDHECITYVVIRNGDSAEAPMLGSGKYCGYDHENRGELESSSNSVFITYAIEGMHRTLKGFKTFRIRYEEKGHECGLHSKLDADHNWETINSPNYPSVPVSYSECVWVFTGPPGEILRVDFLDRFDLDRRNDCSLEYVEIRDGLTEYAPLKGKFCRDKPGTIKVTNNVVYIKYHSQIAEPRNGFKANVSIDICGGTIIARKGEVVSPGYPHLMPLPYGAICEWRIIGSNRQTFLIKPQDIQLPESETECGTKITVEEAIPINKTIAVLRSYCSDQEYETDDLYPFETSSNEVSIKLHVGKTSEWSPTSSNRGFRFTFNTSRITCGGSLSFSEGYLSTPAYPRETMLRYCLWKITVPDKTRRIRLELLDSDLEKHRIDLYNDLRYQSHLRLINGNGSSIGRVFESTGNTLSVSLWLNPLATHHRFKAKFSSDQPALCGGTLSGATGVLVSPDLDRSYLCQWKYKAKIQAQESNISVFDTLLMKVKLNSSVTRTRCGYYDPKINIRVPNWMITLLDSEDYIMLKSLCGNVDTTLRLPSNEISLTANKNSRDSLYFNIEWKIQPCGGQINIGEKEINIINIPPNYNESIDCIWYIKAPIESRLQMKLEGSFELDCDNEFLKIVTGDTPIGDYCKDRLQDSPLLTPFENFFVEYHANNKKKPPIKLLVKSATDHCGGILLDYDSIFHSPHFPKSYDSNIECTWEIKTSVGNRISLQFIDRFAIEDVTNCTKDAVIIYDWIRSEGAYAELARLCGRVKPPIFNSTFNQMKVVFRTDAETTLDGFKAMWQPICGGNFIATYKEQYIFSPGYPNEYQPLQDCKYIISGEDKKVFIKFLEFELEGTYPTCRYDNVTMTANSDYSYLDNYYCGSDIPPPTHEYTEITLSFKTDSYIQRRGFKVAYSLYTCGGEVKNPTMISSHLGDNYDPNENCTWKIEAPPDKVVVIKFQYIDLERTTECYNDYVAVFNGPSINNNKRLALLCGHIPSPTELQSENNTMLLQFVSDSSLNYNGFKAFVYFTYSSAVGCGGNINLPAAATYTLKSPLIGNNILYENFLKCRWEVTAPQDHVIRIEFKSFHVASCDNVNQTALGFSKCDCDYVEVKDGLNPSALVIGTYCGHNLPPQLLSSNNMMSVALSTDGEIQSSGFEALLRVQRSVCGQAHVVVSHTAQSLKTPGFDTGSISRGTNCLYHFNNPEDYMLVHLILKTVDLRGGSLDPNQCDRDKVIVSSISASHNISLGKEYILSTDADIYDIGEYMNYEEQMDSPQQLVFCGKKQNVDLYLTGSIVVSVQTSPESDGITHRGVELEAVYAGFCGRNYTEPYGRIRSINRQSEESLRDCFTLITAPENYTVAAYFLRASPDYWNNDVYLDVYDGKRTNARKLLRIQHTYDNGDTPVFSSGRYLLLHNHFSSGDHVTYDLNYVTTNKQPGCGGNMHGIVGKITSPLYPNFYRVKGSCEWELETPINTKLRLRFTVFDLGVNCEQNFVQLVDRSGAVISTYCSETPAVYTSTDNYIKVVYTTTMNNAGTGWVLQFNAVRL